MNKILNLNTPDVTEIPYKINQFPDGQRSITLLDTADLYKKTHVVILLSISSFSDIELLLSTVSALSAHTKDYSLFAPYMFGARSDRKFELGGDMYLDDVIIPVLKKCELKSICALDFHTSRDIIHSINPEYYLNINNDKNVIYVFPDESAKNRYKHLLRTDVFLLRTDNYGNANILSDHIYFRKERVNGDVKQILVNEIKGRITEQTEFVILDDLFDGGRSYVSVVEHLKETYPTNPIEIVTTHFIGSNELNLIKLKELGVKIHTTNSYYPFYFNNCGIDNTYAEYENISYVDVLSNDIIKKLLCE